MAVGRNLDSYINVLYLVLVLVFNRLKNADNKVKAIIKTFK